MISVKFTRASRWERKRGPWWFHAATLYRWCYLRVCGLEIELVFK